MNKHILRQDDLRFLRQVLRTVALPSLTLGEDADEPTIQAAARRCEMLAVTLDGIADGMCHDDSIVTQDGVTDYVHGV